MITIRLDIPIRHASSPYHDVLTALRALAETIEKSTPKTPSFGGKLYDHGGLTIGAYVVEFS